ncbi:MAG: hypothetical protein MJ107_00805 [Lachnospiraceae bacterium]|nr:hypothetical protein [Lachnospiraceae bacterium]
MKLIAYSTASSGGMLGGRSSTSVFYTDDGRCKVEITDKPAHNQPTTHKKYYADGLLEKLSEICERYNVAGWTNLTGESISMLDAASGSDKFTFENGTTVILESKMAYPQYVYEMFQEFRELIKDFKGSDVEVEVTEDAPFTFASMGMMGFQTANNVNPKVDERRDQDVSDWAKFCRNCGTKFEGNQKFCAECGSVREKSASRS